MWHHMKTQNGGDLFFGGCGPKPLGPFNLRMSIASSLNLNLELAWL